MQRKYKYKSNKGLRSESETGQPLDK